MAVEVTSCEADSERSTNIVADFCQISPAFSAFATSIASCEVVIRSQDDHSHPCVALWTDCLKLVRRSFPWLLSPRLKARCDPIEIWFSHQAGQVVQAF